MNKQSKQMKALIAFAVICIIVGISSISDMLGEIADIFAIISFDLSDIFRLIIMIVFVLSVAYLLQFIFSSLKFKSKRANTITTVVLSMIQYVAAIVIMCWGLTILGVSLSTVFAGVGILALIVGFGAESLIADVITGLFMLFENQCNVGDIVEVNGFRGTIRRIGIRTTVIMDGGDNLKIINNSDMKNILNRSADMSRASCDVIISYDVDLLDLEAKLPAILSDIQKKHMDEMLEVPSYSGVQMLGSNGMTLRFSVMVKEEDIYSTARILNRELFLALKQQGISPVQMPYVSPK